MAQPPRVEPFSVPDPLAGAWDEMVALNRRLQARNDPLGDLARAANRGASHAADGVSELLRRADMPSAQWHQIRTQQVRGEAPVAAPATRATPAAPTAASQPAGRLPKLRGPIRDSDWKAAGVHPSGDYLADLSHPETNPFMTTCADGDCRHSRIDPYPASNLGRSYDLNEVRAGLADIRAGRPTDMGPHITFINDIPTNPSPDQPLTTPTARMVTAAILQSGAHDVNINSTIGGKHARKPGQESRHYSARAVDINRVNGAHVSPQHPARWLQDAFLAQPNIAEDFGPSYQLNDKDAGRVGVTSAKVIRDHKTHLHFAGDK